MPSVPVRGGLGGLGVLAACALSLAACGSPGGSNVDAAMTGGRSGSGGASASGGRSASGGGAATGGTFGTGGAATGGAATGGANTGGANTGGANTGGAATGGAATGGAATGGANTGGAATGGAATGGANTGGAATGGAATGGANTGGAATGGTAAGGANTGGANTGGATPGCTPSAWTTEAVVLQPETIGAASPQGTVRYLGIATDSTGLLHLLYNTSGSSNQVLYAQRPLGGPWSTATQVQFAGWAGNGDMDLAVAADGTVHTLYTIGDTSKAIGYRRRSPAGVWTPDLGAAPTILYSGTASGAGPDAGGKLALDSGGNPQCAYAVQVSPPADPWVPYHATIVSGTWQSTLMNISYGASPAIAVDGSGTSHVALRTGATGLSYAFRASGGTTWTTEVIDANGRYNAHVAVTGTAIPHVLYYTGTELRHAVRAGTNVWSSESVVASATAEVRGLVVTSDGTLHALIVDAGQAIYYRKVSGGSWTNGTIATAVAGANRHRALAIEPSGVLHAVFMQGATAKAHAWACIP